MKAEDYSRDLSRDLSTKISKAITVGNAGTKDQIQVVHAHHPGGNDPSLQQVHMLHGHHRVPSENNVHKAKEAPLPGTQPQHQDPEYKNEEPKSQNEEPKSQNQEPGSKNEEPESQNEEPESQNQQQETKPLKAAAVSYPIKKMIEHTKAISSELKTEISKQLIKIEINRAEGRPVEGRRVQRLKKIEEISVSLASELKQIVPATNYKAGDYQQFSRAVHATKELYSRIDQELEKTKKSRKRFEQWVGTKKGAKAAVKLTLARQMFWEGIEHHIKSVVKEFAHLIY